ncbi:MAG: thiamine pyrophosphate-dependent enzyme, partial [Candidatus Hodarchaeales archaeon]
NPLSLKLLAETNKNLFESGHRLCAGCAEGTIARLATMATTRESVIVNATSCLEVASTIYPFTSWKLPWIHNAFENAAATGSGIDAAYKAMYRNGKYPYEKTDIIVFGGDGGTYDIGLQSLSGAVERGADFLYICYNNGAYMNTGIQRSSGTPRGAATTTSPGGKVVPGKQQFNKDLMQIMIAHDIPYTATASPAYPKDFIRKVRTGLDVDGPAFILADAPCPRGHRFDTHLSLDMSRLAIETCFHPMYEVVKGEYKLNPQSMKIARDPEKYKKPITKYLEAQGRFKHIFKHEEADFIIKDIQDYTDRKWEKLLYLAKLTK